MLKVRTFRAHIYTDTGYVSCPICNTLKSFQLNNYLLEMEYCKNCYYIFPDVRKLSFTSGPPPFVKDRCEKSREGFDVLQKLLARSREKSREALDFHLDDLHDYIVVN